MKKKFIKSRQFKGHLLRLQITCFFCTVVSDHLFKYGQSAMQTAQADLIFYYKSLHSLVDVDVPSFVTRSRCAPTRGNSFKLAKFLAVLKLDKNFFSNLLVYNRNCLQNSIIMSSSISSFKRIIGRFNFSQFLSYQF